MSDEKNTPIWKKEISFRRKPDEGAPESDAGSASIWKKEISLGKKGNEVDIDGVSEVGTEGEVDSQAPVEAPSVDLDLIAKYAPLPDPIAPPLAAGAGRAGRGRARPDRARVADEAIGGSLRAAGGATRARPGFAGGAALADFARSPPSRIQSRISPSRSSRSSPTSPLRCPNRLPRPSPRRAELDLELDLSRRT